jgi:hypothetical protein
MEITEGFDFSRFEEGAEAPVGVAMSWRLSNTYLANGKTLSA